MAVDNLTSLSRSAQQHATNLHSQLSQLLNHPASPQDHTAEAELRQLITCNAQLARAITTPGNTASAGGDEMEELQAACCQRQDLLQDLLHALDDSVLTLRAQLDACHKLVHSAPCKEDPEDIIRYAFTLRHGFAPLGSAPGLMQVPPAPQLPFMLCSTLRLYHMDLAAQQQQAGQAGVQAPQQPQQLPPVLSAKEVPPAGQQLPAEGAAAAAAAAAPPQPVFDFMLNADLHDEDDMGVGSEVSEEYSTSETEESAE